MVTRASILKKPAVFAALGFILAAAGCQSGNPLGALNVGGGQQDAGQERISSDELLAFCPSVTIRERQAVHDTFQRGGEGDAARLVFRASLTEATRACTHSGDMLGMTVAVAGRVVPGPAGTSGTVRVPIRVTAYSGQEIIHDRVQEHEIAIADVAGATQFVFSDASISMPKPSARRTLVFVSFDAPRAAR